MCGPNPETGPLVDIHTLPSGYTLDPKLLPEDYTFEPTILGMDMRGNLLFCSPGKEPVSISPNLPQPSDLGLHVFAYDSNTLYLLDPGNNAVWYYRNMEIDQPPHLYFGSDRPDDVQGMIDMIVNGDDLYLLHKDGYIVKCLFGGMQVSPTRCDDPASFIDSRPGRKKGPVILDARFSQMMVSPPPDPSLYILDPVNVAVYHFGLRLTFQRQFRSLLALPSSASIAFSISQDRNIFLVIGNQVYSSLLP
jgi:hypothetical protein